ncbi:LacI family transcriptional regulator [Metabacillus litoralis]|uniref:Catabolite control protein A n=1 Tax=Metabacillus litoralis TaxID=152268 RepID=A0A5C6VZI0_9BACI|nr:LacI family DNA-binding transcriptional regulator [Metabacillus litoralis]TXC90988.1 LacI family transcriptional regulator [Metabacillus litoralis]
MSTIKQVAQEAGVSVATVSRVLNSNGYVNEETRKKVLQTIEKLNYKPNAVARSLFKKQSKTIALIVPNISNPFFPEVARAIEDVMSGKEYTLILCNSDDKEEKEQHYFEMMKQKYVDGVIIATSTVRPKYIEKSGIPIVAVDRFINEDIPYVSVNNTAGAIQAVRYLKSTGCKKIAHIRGPEYIHNSEERYQGYLKEVQGEGWFHPELIVNGNFESETTIKATEKLLTKYPDIDSIFAGNDYMALSVIKAALRMGKRIPEDLSVIGFDGINLSKLTNPELTTIEQPIYDIGYKAAELLLDVIEGRPLTKIQHELDVSLYEGQTTKR